MSPRTGWFAEDTAVPLPLTSAFLSALRTQAPDRRLPPAQLRFNHQLARIDMLRQQIGSLQALADTQRPLYHRTLHPLRERRLAVMRKMAIWLDERLHGRGLSFDHKQTATELLCEMCEHLAAGGDEDMRALHDKHSPHSIEDKQQMAAARVRAMMERASGYPLDTDPSDPIDDVREADIARRQHAKARRKPAAAQRRAAQQQQDADTILRKLHRQLSSALHPDRELDPDSRTRKNALMVEANTAYARRDLVALLHIQLHLEQADPQALSRMAEEKITSMNLLLSQQTATLERELDTRRQSVQQEFGLHPFESLTAASLQRHLSRESQALKHHVAAMERDLRTVRDDVAFKRWLKLQKRLSVQDNDSDYADD